MRDATYVVNAAGAFSNDPKLTGVTISSQFGSTQNLVNLDNLFSGDAELTNIHMAAGNTGGTLQESPSAHAYGAFDGCNLDQIQIGFANDKPSDGLSNSLLNDFYASYYKALYKVHVFVGENWTASIGYYPAAYNKVNPTATAAPTTWTAAAAAKVSESDNGGSAGVTIPPTASTQIQALGYYDPSNNNKVKDGTGGNSFSALYKWPDGTYYSINVDIYAIPKVNLTSPISGASSSKLSDTITQTSTSSTVDISKYLTSVTGYDGKSDTAQASTPVITYTPTTGGTAQTVTSVDSSKAGTYTVTWTALDPTSGQALAAGDDPSTPGQFSTTTATGTLTLTVAPAQTTTTVTTYTLTPPTLGSYFIYNTIWDDPQPTIIKKVTTTDSKGNSTTTASPYTLQSGDKLSEVFNSLNNAPAWDTTKGNQIDHSGSYQIDYTFTPAGSSDSYTTYANLTVGNHAFFQAKPSFPKILPKGTDLTQYISDDYFLATNYDNSSIPITYQDNQTVTLADGSTMTVPHATVMIDKTNSTTTATGTYQTVTFDLVDPTTGNPIYKGDGSRSQWTISLQINNLAELDVAGVPENINMGQSFDPTKYITKAVSYDGTTDLTKSVIISIADSNGKPVTAADMTKTQGTYTVTYNLVSTDANGNTTVITDSNNSPITAGPYTVTVSNPSFTLPYTGSRSSFILSGIVIGALLLSLLFLKKRKTL